MGNDLGDLREFVLNAPIKELPRVLELALENAFIRGRSDAFVEASKIIKSEGDAK